MKIKLVWKDPDYCETRTGECIEYDADVMDKLHKLGCGEYLVVEFDTDAMTARVIPHTDGL